MTMSIGVMTDYLKAPVQDHIRYKTVVFDASLGKKTIYMEDPSPRVDKAWEDLYGELHTITHHTKLHPISTLSAYHFDLQSKH